jgi:hypothetical protein
MFSQIHKWIKKIINPQKNTEVSPSSEKKDDQTLPFGLVQDGCGSCQCYCPNCDYGKGHMTHFFSWDVRPKVFLCPSCGNKYNGIAGVDG